MEVEDGLQTCGVIDDLFTLLRTHGLCDALAMHVTDRTGRLSYAYLAYDHTLEHMSPVERRRMLSCLEMLVRHAADVAAPVEARELSPQERKVMENLALGQSNKQIARNLDLSLSTVNTLVNRSFEKLGVKNRSQAAVALILEIVERGFDWNALRALFSAPCPSTSV